MPLLSPFLLGTLLALLAEPGVRFLSGRLRLPRPVAAGIGVTAVVTAICVLLLILGNFLFRELKNLVGVLPDLESTAQSGIRMLQNWLLDLADHSPRSIRPMLQMNVNELFSGGTAFLKRVTAYILGLAGALLSHIPDGALSAGTAVLAAYMISAKMPGIRLWCRERLPLEKLAPVWDAWKRIRSAAWLWFVSQIKLASVTFLVLTGGFLLLRISYAPFLALLTALVDAFPVLGTGTVMLPWSLILFLQQDNPRALGMIGLYILVWAIRSFLEPRLVGRQLGLDPLVTLISLYAGYKLWGILGILLMPLLTASAFSLLPGEQS